MKTLLTALLALVGILNSPAQGLTNLGKITVTTSLVWDKNPEPDVIGYYVYAYPTNNPAGLYRVPTTTNGVTAQKLIGTPRKSLPFFQPWLSTNMDIVSAADVINHSASPSYSGSVFGTIKYETSTNWVTTSREIPIREPMPLSYTVLAIHIDEPPILLHQKGFISTNTVIEFVYKGKPFSVTVESERTKDEPLVRVIAEEPKWLNQ
jgi:hypothetical protein